jgi:hypothetical protein
MQIKEIIIPNSRLTEGSYHTFKLLKHQQFSEQESLFILQDSLGYKVMLPAGYYIDYGFTEGQDMLCRVDRINCSGRMFLEPVHPVYREGEWYDFYVEGAGSRQAITGLNEYYVRVKDIHNREWDIRLQHPFNTSLETLTCRLERIKKGRFYLTAPLDSASSLVEGDEGVFLILGETIHPDDNMRYFIVEDQQGYRHIIPKRYYLHYRLKKDQQVLCRVGKMSPLGYHFLEPQNPWYKREEIYELELLELHRLRFSDGALQDVAVVDDPYNEPVKVFIDDNKTNSIINAHKVRCKVTGFRKSRPEFIII